MENLIEELKISGWSYFLERKQLPTDPEEDQEDGWGDVEESWVEIQEIDGVIQGDSLNPETRRGYEEIADYMGFFIPNFEIDPDELGQYRIKNIITSSSGNQFTRYFRIKKINRNLVLENEIHHYEFDLELQQKYG
jgi:hypothetical protein